MLLTVITILMDEKGGDLKMTTLTEQSLELGQLVKDVIAAKQALVKQRDGNTGELFKAIDKLEEFYKPK